MARNRAKWSPGHPVFHPVRHARRLRPRADRLFRRALARGPRRERPRLLSEPGPRDNSKGRRPTLPPGFPGSTIGAGGLNFSVRNGKRCDPSAKATPKWMTTDLRDAVHTHDAPWRKKPVKPHG